MNNEYADFVGLGRSLGGGEGKVEDLRVGLWGVRREVEGLVGKLKGVEGEAKADIKRRREVMKEKGFVKELLGVARRLDDIEILLLLEEGEKGSEGVGYRAVPHYGDDSGIENLSRLEREVDAYLSLKHVLDRLPPGVCEGYPFMKTQMQRVDRVRKTILLDLGTALRSAAIRGDEELVIEGEEERRKVKVVGLMGLFLSMGESGEAVRILKEVGRGNGGVGRGSLRRGGLNSKQGSLRIK